MMKTPYWRIKEYKEYITIGLLDMCLIIPLYVYEFDKTCALQWDLVDVLSSG